MRKELGDVSKNQHGQYWCPVSAMVHAHAKWSMAARCGTSVDRLHHPNSMSNLTIHIVMQEQNTPTDLLIQRIYSSSASFGK